MISVEGPSKADIKFEDKKDGSSVVSYKCTDPGKLFTLQVPAAAMLPHLTGLLARYVTYMCYIYRRVCCVY